MQQIVIHWFRKDLRISDNPALSSLSGYEDVMPIFIFDNVNILNNDYGKAQSYWLHYSLISLSNSLKNKLNIYIGDPQKIFAKLASNYDIKKIVWNRCYEPWIIERDKKIKAYLKLKHIAVESFNGSLLWEPHNIVKKDGTPYMVFTPYYRKGCLLSRHQPRDPITKPDLKNIIYDNTNSVKLDSLKLLPQKYHWHEKFIPYWDIGEKGSIKTLTNFLEKGIKDYKDGRNFPVRQNVSKLSPYLAMGEISPNQIWHEVKSLTLNHDTDHFLSELGWREFAYNLLYHNPDLRTENLQKKFDKFPWQEHKNHLLSWQKGRTGYPIVDAGMRQLWQTGYMHNRLRMIVASFLVKNLLIHWHEGERWFHECLVDADYANNAVSWQWVAGCGADAAPYFRIFNPITQGEKFDQDGKFTKKFIPELSKMPTKYLFCPWSAPAEILKQADVELGKSYPYPIVDVKKSRERALKALSSLKPL